MNEALEVDDTRETDTSDGASGMQPLECKLTEMELLAKGHEASDRIYRIALLEEEKKSFDTRIKKDIDKLHDEVRLLARQIRNKSEERDVMVVEQKDHQRGEVYLVREDTHDVIVTRPMTREELQVSLPIPTGRRRKASERAAAE